MNQLTSKQIASIRKRELSQYRNVVGKMVSVVTEVISLTNEAEIAELILLLRQ